MVRLVKGAYWDTEIKLSQVEGHDGFPVFTQKPSTDVSYICCAKKLLGMTDRIFPQFATHNAHSVAAILEMAEDKTSFEFQRLHGMGEALHDTVLNRQGTHCRIYAPVGAHEDLLAYLVRRLLENGANSSFVNQIVDETVPPAEVVADPFALVAGYMDTPHNPRTVMPADLFRPMRANSKGFDILDPVVVEQMSNGMAKFADKEWSAHSGAGPSEPVINPATKATIGQVTYMTKDQATKACETIKDWSSVDAKDRAKILNKVADLYEENAYEIFALLQKEAGKTVLDCVGELREAVDFLRFYAAQSLSVSTSPAGIFTCISPWNFPLAIFTGQISAALATGNGVLAKSAETTPLIAEFAINLMHIAGVPRDVLIHVCGLGGVVGPIVTSHANVNGVCFTGSTNTAQIINRSMAQNLDPAAPLIAETGGLNAMIVDSTALPEQAVRDILASAFQSAGQRCSALRVLYIQADVADNFKKMLFGAMDELQVGNPSDLSTDVGPLIDEVALDGITAHIEKARKDGRLLKEIPAPQGGYFVPPTVLAVDGIGDLETEIFGPVLHIATYEADEIDTVMADINATGYGLTFGLHSRIDDRVQQVVETIEAGNIYVNRNQIGAVVGSQPFGGEGLSGTGPKAGGTLYLQRFLATQCDLTPEHSAKPVSVAAIEAAFEQGKPIDVSHGETSLPGPTGESNIYTVVPRHNVLCLGPSQSQAKDQADQARKLGCNPICVVSGIGGDLDGKISPPDLTQIKSLDAVISYSKSARPMRIALAERTGAIVPLLCENQFARWLTMERHLCVDTTAAGGNAALLSEE
jgi:RHH-type proline utilization regulon transcriptional repressor/proline dehydrogenase/delta 1-pyrroline-5-carboxylate dehydrogenase